MRKNLLIDNSWNFREKLDKKIFIEDIFNILDQREKFIIYNRYGFTDKDLSYREIGRILNISQERVRQIELKCLRKIRYWSKNNDFDKAYYSYDRFLERQIVNEVWFIIDEENEHFTQLLSPVREYIKKIRLKNICKNFTFKEVNGRRSYPLRRLKKSSKKQNKKSIIYQILKNCYFYEFEKIREGIERLQQKIYKLYVNKGDFYFRFYLSINGLSFLWKITPYDTIKTLSKDIYSFLLTARALKEVIILSIFCTNEQYHFKI